MLVKLLHQSHTIFLDDPSRFIAVFVIFESVINGESCHPTSMQGFRGSHLGLSRKIEGCFATESLSRIT